MENRRTVLVIFLLAGLAAMAVGLFMAAGGGGPGPNILGNSRKMTMLGILALIGLFAVIVIIGSLVRASRKKADQWREQADALDDTLTLDFNADPPKDFHREYVYLPEIKKSGKTHRLAQGTIADHNATFFEHRYVVSTGQSTHTVIHCVYATDAPGWPDLSVTPRHPFSKLMRSLGWRKGLLLDDPQFNHRFVVKCDDEPFAVTLLTPEMQQFLLGKPNARWRITHNKVFLIYRGALKLDRMPASIDRMARFWSHVPREVAAWKSRGII